MTRQVIKILSPEEETKLLTWLEHNDRRYHTGAVIMLTTGLRVSEVCSLKVRDVMNGDKPRTAIELRKEQTKNGKPRTLPLPASTQETITKFLHRSYYYARTNAPDAPLLCSSRSDEPLQPRDFQRAYKTAGIKALGRPVNPHLFRHTYATRMKKVLGAEDLQALLGHDDLRTTMIYYHADLEELTTAVNKARNLQPIDSKKETPRQAQRLRKKLTGARAKRR